MNGCIYRAIPRGSLYFTPETISKMLSHRQVNPSDTEAGGVLLGRYLEGTEDVIVEAITEPMLGDRRQWAGFFRSFRHQFSAQRRWRRRSRTSAYLGSWHSHPEQDPYPSAADTADWQHALTTDTYDGTRLFFVILGIERLRVWQGDRYSEFVELELSREHYENAT